MLNKSYRIATVGYNAFFFSSKEKSFHVIAQTVYFPPCSWLSYLIS